MAHPYQEHRQPHHEKERVKHLCRGGYASGGAVKEREVAKKALASHKAEHEALKGEGKKPKHRADRVKRAKGGRVKHKSGKTNVNVIVAPKGGDGAPPMPPMAGLAPHPAPPPVAAAPAAPPMAAKPPMPPMGVGAPPPGMPLRKKGGRVQHDTKAPVIRAKGGKGLTDAHYKPLPDPGGTTNNLRPPTVDKKGTMAGAEADAKRFRGVTDRKRGGKVGHASENGGINGADKQGRTGIGFRQPVQHSGNKDDTQNIGRGKPITYAKGGKVRDANEIGGEKQYAKAVKFDSEWDGDGNKPAGGRKQYEDGWNVHAHGTIGTKNGGKNRATGGPIYAEGKENSGMGPDDEAGSRSGIGRIRKAHRAASRGHV